jgi:hypothetical protein
MHVKKIIKKCGNEAAQSTTKCSRVLRQQRHKIGIDCWMLLAM